MMTTRKIIAIFMLAIGMFLVGCNITTATTTTASDTTATTAQVTTTTTDSALTTTTTTTEAATTTTTATTTAQVTTLRVFTLQELSQYNGDNGSLAYVAFYGTVYDVTNADQWHNGWHQGFHLAGTDGTALFESASPHNTSIFNGLPIVGTLAP